jgi:hypothetical protein
MADTADFVRRDEDQKDRVTIEDLAESRSMCAHGGNAGKLGIFHLSGTKKPQFMGLFSWSCVNYA